MDHSLEFAAANQDKITDLLNQWGEGDRHALDHVVPLIYEELRVLARARLRGQGNLLTFNTEGLIHEVYLRLQGKSRLSFENRKQFFCFAGSVMRNFLLEYGRGRSAVKRGGGESIAALSGILDIDNGRQIELNTFIAVGEALDAFIKVDARAASVVELRFFAGLTGSEIGEVLEISEASVARDWRYGKRWLARALAGRKDPNAEPSA